MSDRAVAAVATITYPTPPERQPWEPEQPITDEQGRAAMRYIKQAQVVAFGKYVFTVMWNVSMAYVEPGDILALFNTRSKSCCGRPKRRAFYYASATDVAHHEGHRP